MSSSPVSFSWALCNVDAGADYIPCLDNLEAIKKLRSTKHYEHQERDCPEKPPTCLVPPPEGYRNPIRWPKSRDQVCAGRSYALMIIRCYLPNRFTYSRFCCYRYGTTMFLILSWLNTRDTKTGLRFLESISSSREVGLSLNMVRCTTLILFRR